MQEKWMETEQNLRHVEVEKDMAIDQLKSNKRLFRGNKERLDNFDAAFDTVEKLDEEDRISRLKIMYEEQKRFKKYAQFYDKYDEECVELHAGHLEARYFHEGKCVSRSEMRHLIISMVHDLASEFEKHDIKYFLDSGSFLGALRHMTVIPWDLDADFGVLSEDMEKIRNAEFSLNKTKYAFEVFQSHIHPQGERDKGIPGRLIHKGTGLYMDIFEYVDKDPDAEGNRIVGLVTSGASGCYGCKQIEGGGEFNMSINWIFPTQDCVFAGRTLPCPGDTYNYLNYIYGPNFTEPGGW